MLNKSVGHLYICCTLHETVFRYKRCRLLTFTSSALLVISFIMQGEWQVLFPRTSQTGCSHPKAALPLRNVSLLLQANKYSGLKPYLAIHHHIKTDSICFKECPVLNPFGIPVIFSKPEMEQYDFNSITCPHTQEPIWVHPSVPMDLFLLSKTALAIKCGSEWQSSQALLRMVFLSWQQQKATQIGKCLPIVIAATTYLDVPFSLPHGV